MRIFYSLLFASMLPLMVLRLLWRGLRQRGYRENMLERFGFFAHAPLKDCLWIHAVSVGETRAAQPLVRRLKERYPDHPVLLTCMTPTGRATAQALFGNEVTCVYLPYDLVLLHERLFCRFQPRLLLVMETEIWPNLFHACHLKQIPALIINARMSEKSSLAYGRFGAVRSLLHQTLQLVDIVAAQFAADAERFRILGASEIAVTGNIKFDITLSPELVALGTRWKAQQPARRVLLCASTREDEETLLLAAYKQAFDAKARRDTLLVIVPRHPQRFDVVAEDIRGAGLSLSRRSQGLSGTAAEVLLGDSMGEMTAYYSFCDVVIIGGSFMPLGGQNLIEACASGRPVIMGPSVFNFSEAAKLATEVGAMLQVDDALTAMRAAHELLNNNARLQEMSAAGVKLVEANRGATEKTLALITRALGVN
ncbi:MAG: 3-deoxy-D-manno-octulosonic acid transferase [Betaproteobacteria bacterium]